MPRFLVGAFLFGTKQVLRYLLLMIQLVQGHDTDVVVTLTEKVTLANPFYLFVFTHETTKAVISMVLSSGDDLSLYTSRYNEFTFSASYFLTAAVGKYTYQVFEQDNSYNIITTGLNEVENGKMDLNKATSFAFQTYTTATNYTSYAG